MSVGVIRIVLLYYLVKGIVFFSIYFDNNSYFYMLDVGQGDAILLEGKHSMLIDGGVGYGIDSHFSYMFPFKTCPVDVLVLTHPHADHLEGLLRLAYRCPNATIIYPKATYESSLFGKWEDEIATKNSITMKKGDSFILDNLAIYVLWPPENFISKDINDVSLSLLIDMDATEVLLTGDLAAEYFSSFDYSLLNRTIDSELDYYKSSHHGSSDGLNSSFLDAFTPTVCLIPVGVKNPYGHPDPETLKYFTQINCTIYRSDLDGTIKIPISSTNDEMLSFIHGYPTYYSK